MAKNHMPVAHFGARPVDVRADVVRDEALARWRPEVQARAAVSESAFVIDVLGLIGETWDDTGTTDAKIGALLRSAGEREVVVNINSPGGDLFDGISIYNLLRQHKGDVTVRVVGIAASSASIIALAGDRIEIARSGFLMIHNAWTIAAADKHGFRGVASQLEVFDEAIADLYALRSRLDVGQIAKMMDAETYLSGRDAIEKGFADELLAADAIEVSARAKADAPTAKAAVEFSVMAKRSGYSRSKAIDLRNRLTSKPSAADDDMPSAVESLAALHGSVKSLLGNKETR